MTGMVELNGKTIEEFANRVLGYVTGSGIGAMIFLGDQVGLYRAMDGAGSLTSHQVAERAGLHPRWVQEWLHTQVCAGLLHYETRIRHTLSRPNMPRSWRGKTARTFVW